MTRVAFYAPMKPPDDPVPSGDRTMAQAILLALSAAGAQAQLVSRFRSRDKAGNSAFQNDKFKVARAERARLIAQGKAEGWQIWVSYHNYYKAPDLIGPAVSHALNIPYIVIEATRARKRLTGPWARYAAAAEAACDAADALLYMTQRDAEALNAYRAGAQHLVHFPPFLTADSLPVETGRDGNILTVGMMRHGDKYASYQIIAETLSELRSTGWRLIVAGDGPARPQIEGILAPFAPKITFLGAVTQEELSTLYTTPSILFWPGVNEAFGMAYLEAQAAGLTVLAQDRPGVRDVLEPGAAYPCPRAGAHALSARLDLLLAHPKLTLKLGQAARRHVAQRHLLNDASARLRSVIAQVCA